ncbi:hypothetical protein [Microbacterium sp. LWH3-1.2]|uniref:hypothetical protein n=1 Tax=Microbacterium sp. LWH3-1.2 TaxID=3135256 RepID=UPI0034342B7F
MDTARVTRRRGPLSALEGPSPAIAIGDVAARHVRLMPDGLARHIGERASEFVMWAQVHTVTVDPPSTRFPYPALGDTAVALLGGSLGGLEMGETAETPTFVVAVATLDGERREWRATQHYLSGYRRADAQATTRLVEYLVARGEARLLLGRPAELLDRVAALLRPAPRIGP